MNRGGVEGESGSERVHREREARTRSRGAREEREWEGKGEIGWMLLKGSFMNIYSKC